jgi:hypothetical protein
MTDQLRKPIFRTAGDFWAAAASIENSTHVAKRQTNRILFMVSFRSIHSKSGPADGNPKFVPNMKDFYRGVDLSRVFLPLVWHA